MLDMLLILRFVVARHVLYLLLSYFITNRLQKMIHRNVNYVMASTVIFKRSSFMLQRNEADNDEHSSFKMAMPAH